MLPGHFVARQYSSDSLVLTKAWDVLSTGSTITIPATAQVGDLAVYADFAAKLNSFPTGGLLSGFSSLVFTTYGPGPIKLSLRAGYKLLELADIGAVKTGFNGDDESKLMLGFRPNRVLATAAPASWTGTALYSDPSSRSVSSGDAATEPVLVVGFGLTESGNVNPLSFTPTEDGDTGSARARGKWKFYRVGDTLADHTVDMGDESANGLCAGYFEFTE